MYTQQRATSRRMSTSGIGVARAQCASRASNLSVKGYVYPLIHSVRHVQKPQLIYRLSTCRPKGCLVLPVVAVLVTDLTLVSRCQRLLTTEQIPQQEIF